MKQVPLFIPFAISCFFALFNSALLPSIPLLAFSPFLAILYNRMSFQKSLVVACLCGLIVDLFSADLRLGVHALNYCALTLLLYNQKRHFFADKPLAVCLFTGLISWVSTAIQWILIPLCGSHLSLSKALLLTDLLLLPLTDMAYAFLCFSCPLMLYAHVAKIGWKAFYQHILSLLRLNPKRHTDESH